MTKTSLGLACLLSAAVAASARGQEKDAPKPPAFRAPKGWQAAEKPSSFLLAQFTIAKGEQTATVMVAGLPGEGGGVVANVNRWRVQVGLKALEERELLKSVQATKVDGVDGHAVDLTGPDTSDKPAQRTVGAIVKHGGQTWFFKLMGPADLVGEQKSAFEEFLKSVRFDKEGEKGPKDKGP
jgi:hypothetical protein